MYGKCLHKLNLILFYYCKGEVLTYVLLNKIEELQKEGENPIEFKYCKFLF